MPSKALSAVLQAALIGPTAPPVLEPRQMIGRLEEKAKPGFLEEMKPMLLAGLADLASTELVRKTAENPREDNPIIRNLQVGGSNAPAMALGTLLQAALFHRLGKPGRALANAQTTISGTLAGQNFALAGQNADRDDRLAVWRSR